MEEKIDSNSMIVPCELVHDASTFCWSGFRFVAINKGYGGMTLMNSQINCIMCDQINCVGSPYKLDDRNDFNGISIKLTDQICMFILDVGFSFLNILHHPLYVHSWNKVSIFFACERLSQSWTCCLQEDVMAAVWWNDKEKWNCFMLDSMMRDELLLVRSDYFYVTEMTSEQGQIN